VLRALHRFHDVGWVEKRPLPSRRVKKRSGCPAQHQIGHDALVPSEGLQAIIDFFRSSPRVEVDLATRRANMDRLMAAIAVVPGTRVDLLDAGGVSAERVVAPGTDRTTWLIYLHGGAYVSGSLSSYRGHVARLSAEIGCSVLNVAYRLAPEHPFPAAVDDATAAYRWLTRTVDPSRVALAGDSAGGGLAVAALLALREAGDVLPAAAALISPWTDLTMTAPTYDTRRAVDPILTREGLLADAALYLAGADPTTPLASPLYGALADLPPMLVQVGDSECLLDDSIRFGERARAAGVDCTVEVSEDAIHIWHTMADFAPEGAEAVQRLATWVRRRLGLDA